MKHGIDISAYQPDVNWTTVSHNHDLDFVYVKATEGTAYTSETFASQHDGAKASGIAVGCYHFFRFGQDGAAQANHFLTATNGRLGDLIPMVDVEVADGQSSLDSMIANLAAFNRTVEQAIGGKRILVYTMAGFWDDGMQGTDAFSGHPLWVASFGRQPGFPVMPTGWSSWVIHQYTQGGIVQGVNGFVDMDVTAADSLSAILR